MDIELDISKSVHENAATYFEKAKKAKGKIEGVKKTLIFARKRLEELQKKKAKEDEQEQQKATRKEIKREWFEKFRWFISSEGILCIGGRDATSNDIIVKKHMDPEDLVFHTEIPGSPFFLIKQKEKKASQITIEECAMATACYSKAWKSGISIVDVFYVTPEQVALGAKSGEFMGKGAFMITGKKNFLHPKLEFAIGIKEGKIISGAVSCVSKQAEKYFKIIQGDLKPSDAAKKLGRQLNFHEMDELIRMLPSGEIKIINEVERDGMHR